MFHTRPTGTSSVRARRNCCNAWNNTVSSRSGEFTVTAVTPASNPCTASQHTAAGGRDSAVK
jgi:hypothetical protein